MIMRQTLDELYDSILAGPNLRTFMQYSITLCSRSEPASDAIAGAVVEQAGVDVRV